HQVALIPDVRADTPLARGFHATPGRPQESASFIRSWMGVPLMVRGQSLGMLSLAHQTPGYYSSEHQRLVLAFANEAALAIENAQLYEGARRRIAEIESLQRVTAALLQKLTLDQVLDVVYREACQLTGANGCALFFWDGGPWLEVAQWGGALQPTTSQVPLEGTFAGQVVLSGEPLIVGDAQQLARARHFATGLESLLVIPMRLQGAIVGALDVANKPGGFTQDDVRILGLFADAAAIAIESARLSQKAGQLAVLEERQRLARELHDSVTQALYTVALYAEATRMALSGTRLDIAAENLEQLHNVAREAMLDMRMLIFELHPPMVEKEGLVGALQARLAAVEVRAGLQTELHAEGERRLPLEVETELFWIALEACNNVVKHAAAARLVVRFAFGQESMRLEIEDDGRGFDLAAARQGGGVGLRGIDERVQRIRGQWAIRSAPGQGTCLHVMVDA
ncbi:MAG TPA: GAF domain-containing sensor histidine kinase, partial [Anaerolineae bacterium]|nr:GAF domain-containing sensor histidine kinase [Anaerolineae bacterium]